MRSAVYSHNTSALDGTDVFTPFFLMFGRNATSLETVALQLSSEPISENELAFSSKDFRGTQTILQHQKGPKVKATRLLRFVC